METRLEIDNFTQNVSLFEGNLSSYQHNGVSRQSVRYSLDVVLLFMAPLGALANIFTFYVLTKHRPQTSNTCILRVLSLVDTLVLCMYFTHALVEKMMDWDLYYLTLVSIISAQILHNCSSYVLIVLSVDRCVLICHALHARKWCTIRNTRRTLSAMFVIPLLYVILFILQLNDDMLYIPNAVTIICAVAILTFNTRIAVELILSARRRVLLTAGQATKPPTGFILNLFVVVTLYILLSIPQLLFWYLYFFESKFKPYYPILRWPWYLCNCINSTVNFVVYCICFKTFRGTVKMLFSKKAWSLIKCTFR